MSSPSTLGILVGGGSAPGINSVICAATTCCKLSQEAETHGEALFLATRKGVFRLERG